MYRTPLQIRTEANGPWPGDTQRRAERGLTWHEWEGLLADAAEADARADAPQYAEASDVWHDDDQWPWVSHPLDTSEVDLFDPALDDAHHPDVGGWDDPADPRDFEPVE